MMLRPNRLWVVGLACFAAVGCAAKIEQVDNPIPVAPQEYDRLYHASIATLRDMQFVIDQQDRRFGLITTQPRIASSMLEPWESDHSAPGQLVRSTMNFQRRMVQVRIEPRAAAVSDAAVAADAGPADAGPAEAGPAVTAETAPSDEYQLRVVVHMQRRQTPQRQPSSAASTRLSFTRGRTAPRVVTESGVQESYWRTIGRDELLEKRLVAEILRRATRMVDTPAPTAETTEPDPA